MVFIALLDRSHCPAPKDTLTKKEKNSVLSEKIIYKTDNPKHHQTNLKVTKYIGPLGRARCASMIPDYGKHVILVPPQGAYPVFRPKWGQ